MKEENIKRATLAEIRAMKDRGELHSPGPGFREELPPGFWDDAELVNFNDGRTSVHLRLDPEVFFYFKAQGKGHLTRMQNVLKAYVKAKTAQR
jgi:hypothetical protein